jgi:hypothetical protein
MADLKHYPDTDARSRTVTVRALSDNLGRPAGEDGAQSGDSARFANVNVVVAVVLGLWLAVVVLLGVNRAFVTQPGTPPLAIAIAVTAPLVVFFAAFWLSPAFRKFVTGADLRLLTMIQAWRWAGFGFISLYVYGVLPGRFAWLAGLGDMAIGFTAPWIALALIRRPSFAGSRLFVIWNLLGILDLVTAVGNAALIQSSATGAVGEVTAAPMALLPLLLIPGYLVPLFIMLHLSSLIQARRLARTERGREAGPIASLGA